MLAHRVVMTSINLAEFHDFELPDRPEPGHLLIRSEATVISAGTELANWSGTDATVHKPGSWNCYPWVAGYGNVGTVVAAGPGADHFPPGTRVFTHGPHASAFHHDISRMVVPVPADLDPGLAAASRMAGVALTGPMLADLGCHQRVAVLGLGMVGNLAAQMSRLLGAQVIGVDPSPARRALARRCGIAETLPGGEALGDDLRRLCRGGSPAVVIDATGRSEACLQAVQVVADFGQVVVLGTPRQSCPGDLTHVFGAIHGRWITVRGALEWNLPHHPVHGLRDSLAGKQEAIFDWLRRGDLHLGELISHRLPPQHAQEAYEGLASDPERFTGVLFEWAHV